jgi:hypothetical protein
MLFEWVFPDVPMFVRVALYLLTVFGLPLAIVFFGEQ